MRSAAVLVVFLCAITLGLASCGESQDSTDQQTADQIRAQADARALERAGLEAEAERQAKLERKAARAKRKAQSTSQPSAEGFSAVASKLSGQQGVAIAGIASGGGNLQVTSAGELSGGAAWSTAKVPVAMAAIKAGTGSQANLQAAITASDNSAAEQLWAGLGGGNQAAQAADAQLRSSGDSRTSIQPDRLRAGFTPFGQTSWSLADQVQFMAGMQCSRQGKQVLGLMQQVVSGQRWGLANVGTAPRFKGGWGPGVSPGSGGPWLERQMGIVSMPGGDFAVAIASVGGNHESGIAALNAISAWLKDDLATKSAGRGC
jgi:hypothetical protein